MHRLRLVRGGVPDGLPGDERASAVAVAPAQLHQLQLVRVDLSRQGAADGKPGVLAQIAGFEVAREGP